MGIFSKLKWCFQFNIRDYNGFEVDVNVYDGLEEVDVSDYVQNNEWGLLRHSAVKNIK